MNIISKQNDHDNNTDSNSDDNFDDVDNISNDKNDVLYTCYCIN